jgi:hypothetical protein
MRAETLSKIEEELKFARENFPGNAMMLAALFEEVGELSKALIEHRCAKKRQASVMQLYRCMDGVAREAVQTAVMAIRILEEGDSDFPYNPESVALSFLSMRNQNEDG